MREREGAKAATSLQRMIGGGCIPVRVYKPAMDLQYRPLAGFATPIGIFISSEAPDPICTTAHEASAPTPCTACILSMCPCLPDYLCLVATEPFPKMMCRWPTGCFNTVKSGTGHKFCYLNRIT